VNLNLDEVDLGFVVNLETLRGVLKSMSVNGRKWWIASDPSSRSSVSCRPQRERCCGISPHTMLERESWRSRKVPGHHSTWPLVRSTTTLPGNGYLLSSSPRERRIVFVVLIIGHLKRILEVHVYGTLMTNYDLQSRLVAFRCWVRGGGNPTRGRICAIVSGPSYR
jgi:hypothetical protein